MTSSKRVFKLCLCKDGSSEWFLDLPELNRARRAPSSCAVGSKLFVTSEDFKSFEVLDTQADELEWQEFQLLDLIDGNSSVLAPYQGNLLVLRGDYDTA